jgi:hypothetical protein
LCGAKPTGVAPAHHALNSFEEARTPGPDNSTGSGQDSGPRYPDVVFGRHNPDRAINTVTCEPLGPKVEAAVDAVDHCLGDGNLGGTVSARALGIDDDPNLVVDEIVCIVSKEWVGALPCDPCRLWIGQRDFFRSAASTAAIARIAVISAATLLITAGGIEDREWPCWARPPPPICRARSRRLRRLRLARLRSASIRSASIQSANTHSPS